MKSRIITNFSNWKALNEQASPGRTKQTAGLGQKVVAIPIDSSSFKIKIVRDLDVIDQNGKLTPDGFNAIISWIKQQPKWPTYYSALNDLTKNIVIYSINRDTEAKQVITFSLQPRPAEIPAATQFAHKSDLQTLIKDQATATILQDTVKTAEATPIKSTDAVTTPKKDSAALLKTISFDLLKTQAPGTPVFDSVKAAYLNMMNLPEFSGLPIMPKVKAELKANKLGDSTVAFIKGIIAGFKIVDEYGDPVEAITPDVVEKLKLFGQLPIAQNSSRNYFLGLDANHIVEQEQVSSLPANFNMDAFLAIVSPVAAQTTSTAATRSVKPPISGKEKIEAFQKYANSKGYEPKLDPDGKWGPKTAAAWKKWGEQFKNTPASATTSTASQSAPTLNLGKDVTQEDLDIFGKIREACAGVGTREKELIAVLKEIKNKEQFIKINNLFNFLSSENRPTYAELAKYKTAGKVFGKYPLVPGKSINSLEAQINDEFGMRDRGDLDWIKQIVEVLKRLGIESTYETLEAGRKFKINSFKIKL
jgi:hypothetical protein